MYIKVGKIRAVNKLLGSGSANGKETGRPGPEEGTSCLQQGQGLPWLLHLIKLSSRKVYHNSLTYTKDTTKVIPR